MHGVLSRQAGNPLVSSQFGFIPRAADYLVWRNQNYNNDHDVGGAWEDDDGALYSEPALQEAFAAKAAAQPNQADQSDQNADEASTALAPDPELSQTQEGGREDLANAAEDAADQHQELSAVNDAAQQTGAESAQAAKRAPQQQTAGSSAGLVHHPEFYTGTIPPDPSWPEKANYIAQEARAYGVPVKLALAVAKHESYFDIHRHTPVYNSRHQITGYDVGIMQINDTNTGWIGGPEGFRFKVDPKRVETDWKYNVHVGMAILRNAYAGVRINVVGEDNAAREAYARYNSRDHWRQLYLYPNGKISQHVNLFMKSWHSYDGKEFMLNNLGQ